MHKKGFVVSSGIFRREDEERMRKKIILIFPKTAPGKVAARVPLSLLAIAGPLEKAGYQVIIMDENVNDEMKINIDGVLFVGISSMTGYQIRSGIEISKMIKSLDDKIVIVWGGWHPSLLPEQTVDNDFVDIVVRGQGQRTVVELADRLKNNDTLAGIPGVTYKSHGKIISNPDRSFEDINNFPPMAYHLIDVEKYVRDIPEINTRAISYISSQGCPFRCGFCADATLNKRRWFGLKPNRVVREIGELVRRYKVDGIIMEDSNFFVDEKRVEEICLGLMDIGIRWGNVNGRQDQLSGFAGRMWSLLKYSGCSSILIGAESGSQQVLDYISKDSKTDYVYDVARKAEQYGILIVFSLVAGFPCEPEDGFDRTVEMLVKISDISSRHKFMLFFYTPYPGSRMYELSVKNGFIEPKSLEEWSVMELNDARMPWLKKDYVDKVEMVSKYFFSVMNNPKFNNIKWLLEKLFMFRMRHNFFSMPIELYMWRAMQ